MLALANGSIWNCDSSELTPEGAGFTTDVECVLSQTKNDSRVKAGVSRLDLNYSRRVTSPRTLQLLAQTLILYCCTIPRFRPRGGQLYFVKRDLKFSEVHGTGFGGLIFKSYPDCTLYIVVLLMMADRSPVRCNSQPQLQPIPIIERARRFLRYLGQS